MPWKIKIPAAADTSRPDWLQPYCEQLSCITRRSRLDNRNGCEPLRWSGGLSARGYPPRTPHGRACRTEALSKNSCRALNAMQANPNKSIRRDLDFFVHDNRNQFPLSSPP